MPGGAAPTGQCRRACTRALTITARAWVTLPSGVFQFASSPIALQDTEIGSLQLAKALDSRYAQELATLSGAATLIASNDTVIASTLPPDVVAS